MEGRAARATRHSYAILIFASRVVLSPTFFYALQEVIRSSLYIEYHILNISSKAYYETEITKVKMNDNTTTQVPNLRNKTQAELLDLVNAYAEKHGPPAESDDGAKNTLFGWTDDGKGVWVLPANRANFKRFEDIAKSRPLLGQCEIIELAGGEFFADWRDSDRARAMKETRP